MLTLNKEDFLQTLIQDDDTYFVLVFLNLYFTLTNSMVIYCPIPRVSSSIIHVSSLLSRQLC